MVFLGVTRVNQVTVVVLLLVASLAQAKGEGAEQHANDECQISVKNKCHEFVIIYGSVKSVKISGFIDIMYNEYTGDLNSYDNQ